jgi:hypothetical protein
MAGRLILCVGIHLILIVSDELLKWHFRQSVLANMKGAGEPLFEHEFSGKDIVQEIREGPCAKERFELELATRLGAAG